MTTTWPRYREECEQPGYVSCAYTHDCGQHMIEQEGRRLGSGNVQEKLLRITRLIPTTMIL